MIADGDGTNRYLPINLLEQMLECCLHNVEYIVI